MARHNAIATIAATLSVLVVLTSQQAWGVPLIGDSHRWAAAGVVVLVGGAYLLGGPLGDGDRTLHVVEAGDEQEVQTRWSRDPWAAAELLEIEAIERWSIWLDRRDRAQSA